MRAAARRGHHPTEELLPREGAGEAKRAAVWHEDILKLFALFDIHGDGVIEPNEFFQVQLLVANSLGLEVRDDVLDVLRDLNMSSHGAAASQHFPAHSRTVDALHKVGFNDVNVDDAGCISCSEFQRCVLLLIEASSSSFASRRRHLSALIQELEGRMKVANPVESWNVLEAAVSAAIDYDELDAAISKAISKVSPKQLDKLAKLIEVWQMRRDALAASETAAVSREDLQGVSFFDEREESQECEGHLEVLRRPFTLRISTFAGQEAFVEVTRDQRVSSLSREVAELFGVKAYRLTLAHAGARLHPPTATLEGCGVTGPECELGAAMGEIDPSLE